MSSLTTATVKRSLVSRLAPSFSLLAVYAFLVVTTPIINIGVGIPFRFDDLLLVYLGLGALQAGFFARSFPKEIFLALFATAFLGLANAMGSGQKIGFSEANDALLFVRLALVVAVVKVSIRTPDQIRGCLAITYLGVCVSLLVGLVQYLRIAPFTKITFDLFTDPEQYNRLYVAEASMGHIYRVVATLSNPNHAAMVFVIGTVVCLGILADYSHRFKRSLSLFSKISIWCTVAGFIFIVTVALSSRTGLVLLAFSGGVFAISFLTLSGSSRAAAKVLVGTCFAAILGVMVYIAIPDESMPDRIRDFVSPERRSFSSIAEFERSRIANWNAALDHLEKNGDWLVGTGPDLGIVVDNGYLQVLMAQGVCGLVLSLLIAAWPTMTFRKAVRYGQPCLVATVLTLLVALALFQITSPLLNTAKLAPLYAVFLGCWEVIISGRSGNRLQWKS